MVLEVKSKQQFQTLTAKPMVTIVDFYADWCGPCRQIAPRFEQLSTQYPSIQFLKVNVDHVDVEQVSAMPTFILYKSGKQLKTIVGADIRGVERALQEFSVKSSGFQGQGYTLSSAATSGSSSSIGIDQVMLYGLIALFGFLYYTK